MKYIIQLLAAICFPVFVFCQDITGLWKGTIFNNCTQQSLEYEIMISKDKGKFTALSHTWFLIEGKKYYGIKKVKVRIARDGKIVLQDEQLMEDNYPMLPYKNVRQLNILDLASQGTDTRLEGPFVTNRTKEFDELTGYINIKRVSESSQSSLMQYLNRGIIGNDITVVK